MKKLFILITLVVVAIAFAVPGQAATLTLDLDTVFPGPPAKPSPAGFAPWVTVDFTDTAPDTVLMKVSANLQNADEFVGSLYFNSNIALEASDFSSPNKSGTFTLPVISPATFVNFDSQKADGDGWFDVKFEFDTSGDTFNNSEWLEYTITASELTANSFDFWSSPGGGEGTYLAAVHIQDANGIPDNSTWVGAVPIPPSVLLLGSGLAGLVGFRRKKIAK